MPEYNPENVKVPLNKKIQERKPMELFKDTKVFSNAVIIVVNEDTHITSGAMMLRKRKLF